MASIIHSVFICALKAALLSIAKLINFDAFAEQITRRANAKRSPPIRPNEP